MSAQASLIEFRARKTSGHTWDEESKDFLPFTGLAVQWRKKGARLWNKHTIIPTNGQTIEGLREKLPEIVERMADRKGARV
jgi:hypothetical protein